VFFGVRGDDTHELESPSFWNMHEANVVLTVIQALLSDVRLGVSTDQFGVICAYWQQVRRVRVLLRKRGLGAVRVGVVNDYQVRECANAHGSACVCVGASAQ
jgi:hypothetical protein